jgi:nicotinamidase-related amidase
MNRYLFVIDYQNDFVDGALGFPGAEKLDEKIAAKVRSYGKGHVLFTRDTHFENYLDTREGRNLPVKHCIKGSFGWEVYGETAKALAELFDVTLVFCFEKKGVLRDADDEDSVIPVITSELFKEYVEKGIIQGGMIPKLENSFSAIDAGVSQVVITLASAIHQPGSGTLIRK